MNEFEAALENLEIKRMILTYGMTIMENKSVYKVSDMYNENSKLQRN